MLCSTACAPNIKTEYVYIYPDAQLTAPTPTPLPWIGITVEDWPTLYRPMMEQALTECNLDKQAIRDMANPQGD